MQESELKELVFRLLDLPMDEVRAEIEKLAPPDLRRLEKLFDYTGQRCARLSGYCSRRGASGCGDNGHDAANQWGIKLEERVRKAQGYNS